MSSRWWPPQPDRAGRRAAASRCSSAWLVAVAGFGLVVVLSVYGNAGAQTLPGESASPAGTAASVEVVAKPKIDFFVYTHTAIGIDKVDGEKLRLLRSLAGGSANPTGGANAANNAAPAASSGPKVAIAEGKPVEGFRPKAWSLGLMRSDLFSNDDRLVISAYLPMRAAARFPRISEKLFDSETPGSLASGMRALQLIAQRRIHAELTYSARLGQGTLDASARFRLEADPNTGKSDLVMGITYKRMF